MRLLKNLLRPLIPKVLLNHKSQYATTTGMWSGNYANWQTASEKCGGYDSPHILEKCRAALLKVKDGTAVYERDSVIFDKTQYSWPLLAILQQIALADGKLHVLDFGGSLGSTYYQNKSFLSLVNDLQWRIVEQDAFVKCGKANFEDKTLKFYESIEQSLQNWQPDVLILSSVLQYLKEPLVWLEKLTSLNIPNIIIDRTSFLHGNSETSRITIQRVPEEIYKAEYPCWFFTENDFLSTIPNNYKLVADFNSYADPDQISDDGLKMYWKGFYFKRID